MVFRSIPAVPESVEHPYAAVYVLLLSWASDKLKVKPEVDRLHSVFKDAYGYQTRQFLIPDDKPDKAVETVLEKMTFQYQNPRSLLIVYYAGHGHLNDAKQAIWTPSNHPDAPQVRWSRHQPILEDSTSDVLLLLDCCHSIGPGGPVLPATGKEILAASGFDGEAPPVGRYSFSEALINELCKAVEQPISTATLHHRIIQNLQGVPRDHRGRHTVNPIWKLMGEGGIPSTFIQLVSYDVYPVNLIAVMGPTGAGKSSLINKICGEDVAGIGTSLMSKTKEVESYNAVVDGQTVTLIDTPGFDDTVLSDREILEKISTYLMIQYKAGRRLNGLLYLRDITVDRMYGSAVKNLDLFIRLVGADSMGNVALITTKWDKASLREAEAREAELKENFWSGMLKLTKSAPFRIASGQNSVTGTVDPRAAIVRPMLKYERTLLQLQRELRDGKLLRDTQAGQRLLEELSQKIDKTKQTMEDVLSTAKRTREKEIQETLNTQADELKKELKDAKTDKKALSNDFKDVMAAEKRRREKLFGYETLSRLDDYAGELEEQDHDFRALGVGLFSYGLYRAFKHVWKKDGASEEDLQYAKGRLRHIRPGE